MKKDKKITYFYKSIIFNSEQSIFRNLKKIYGVNLYQIERACKILNMNLNLKLKNLSLKQFNSVLLEILKSKIKIHNTLRSFEENVFRVSLNKKSYYSFCLKNLIPLRGQSLYSNGKNVRLLNYKRIRRFYKLNNTTLENFIQKRKTIIIKRNKK